MPASRALFLRMVMVMTVALLCTGSAAAKDSELTRANALTEQVVQLSRQGRYADATPLASEALAIREKALGPEHPDVAQSLNNLAELYRGQGRYAEGALTMAYRPMKPGELAASLDPSQRFGAAARTWAEAEHHLKALRAHQAATAAPVPKAAP